MNADESKTSVDKMETTNDETNNHNIMNADETKTSVDETKPLVDETGTTNDETQSTAAVASKGLVVAIANEKYPKRSLKPLSAEMVMGAIKNAASSMVIQKDSEQVKPVLQNVTFDSVTGCVLVECADEETRDWFHKVLPNIGKEQSNIPPLKVITKQVTIPAQQNSTDKPKSTAVETNSLIVAISLVEYPDERLNSADANNVKYHLKKQAVLQCNQEDSTIKPVLKNVSFDSVTGCVMVECADVQTLGWLRKFVPKMSLAKGFIRVKIVGRPRAKPPKVKAAKKRKGKGKKQKVPKKAASIKDMYDNNIYDDNFLQGSADASGIDNRTWIANMIQSGNYSGNSSGNVNQSGNNGDTNANSFGHMWTGF